MQQKSIINQHENKKGLTDPERKKLRIFDYLMYNTEKHWMVGKWWEDKDSCLQIKLFDYPSTSKIHKFLGIKYEFLKHYYWATGKPLITGKIWNTTKKLKDNQDDSRFE